MSNTENEQRTPVLDPIDRVSEIIFGLIMALTFTGTISAATAGREEVRTVMFAALGCNLAWGMVDAVMYLIRTLTERTRNLTLLRRVRSAASPHDAHAIIARISARTPRSEPSAPKVWKAYPPAPRRPARAARPRARCGGTILPRRGRVPARGSGHLSGGDSIHLHHRNRAGNARLECGRAGDPVRGRPCAWTPCRRCSMANRDGDGRNRGGAGGRHHRARGMSVRLPDVVAAALLRLY